MMARKFALLAKVKAELRGGPSGDLYIVIRVKTHEFFEREGDDIYCEVPLNFRCRQRLVMRSKFRR